MIRKKASIIFISIIITCLIIYISFKYFRQSYNYSLNTALPAFSTNPPPKTLKNNNDPLLIQSLKLRTYPGSDISILKTLSPGSNYRQYVVSYFSDELIIYGLLTVPTGQKPQGGWPVILLNHGYIPPSQYSTESSYESFVNPLSLAGFIVFKPDFRGNGSSQGQPEQPYTSPAYIIDSMNALSSIKKFPAANPLKIGVLGHSMGGNVTLHELVITQDIKAAVILSGTVGDEASLISWWNQRVANHSIIGNDLDTAAVVEQMIKDHGTVQNNPQYWNSIDPTQYLTDINAPVQVQVGTADNEVPISFSTSLRDKLQTEGKNVSFLEYPGADHNLAPDTTTALKNAVSFFNQYLK